MTNEKSFYDINKLGEFIFLDNINDKPIQFVIQEGVNNSKELFFVCVELLTVGFKLLYGDANGKVNLKQLDMDKLTYVKRKLKLVKIDFDLNIIDRNDIKENGEFQNLENINLTNLFTSIENLPDNLKLNDYCFHIDLEDEIYLVRFNLLNF